MNFDEDLNGEVYDKAMKIVKERGNRWLSKARSNLQMRKTINESLQKTEAEKEVEMTRISSKRKRNQRKEEKQEHEFVQAEPSSFYEKNNSFTYEFEGAFV